MTAKEVLDMTNDIRSGRARLVEFFRALPGEPLPERKRLGAELCQVATDAAQPIAARTLAAVFLGANAATLEVRGATAVAEALEHALLTEFPTERTGYELGGARLHFLTGMLTGMSGVDLQAAQRTARTIRDRVVGAEALTFLNQVLGGSTPRGV